MLQPGTPSHGPVHFSPPQTRLAPCSLQQPWHLLPAPRTKPWWQRAGRDQVIGPGHGHRQQCLLNMESHLCQSNLNKAPGAEHLLRDGSCPSRAEVHSSGAGVCPVCWSLPHGVTRGLDGLNEWRIPPRLSLMQMLWAHSPPQPALNPLLPRPASACRDAGSSSEPGRAARSLPASLLPPWTLAATSRGRGVGATLLPAALGSSRGHCTGRDWPSLSSPGPEQPPPGLPPANLCTHGGAC